MKYYENQLKKLSDSEYFKSIQISDGIGNKTNFLDLNEESIDVLIEFLYNELDKLTQHNNEVN